MKLLNHMVMEDTDYNEVFPLRPSVSRVVKGV
jgi:hypothetical protein